LLFLLLVSVSYVIIETEANVKGTGPSTEMLQPFTAKKDILIELFESTIHKATTLQQATIKSLEQTGADCHMFLDVVFCPPINYMLSSVIPLTFFFKFLLATEQNCCS